MNFIHKVVFLSVGLVFPALATHVAVLETTAAKDVLTLEEKQYLTDVLRSEAVKALPAEQNYTIMTRENISVMLPPGKAVEDCEGSCLVDASKLIDDTIEIPVQVMGKLKGRVTVSRGASQDDVMAKVNEQGIVAGLNIIKVIYVKDKIINIVAK